MSRAPAFSVIVALVSLLVLSSVGSAHPREYLGGTICGSLLNEIQLGSCSTLVDSTDDDSLDDRCDDVDQGIPGVGLVCFEGGEILEDPEASPDTFWVLVTDDDLFTTNVIICQDSDADDVCGGTNEFSLFACGGVNEPEIVFGPADGWEESLATFVFLLESPILFFGGNPNSSCPPMLISGAVHGFVGHSGPANL